MSCDSEFYKFPEISWSMVGGSPTNRSGFSEVLELCKQDKGRLENFTPQELHLHSKWINDYNMGVKSSLMLITMLNCHKTSNDLSMNHSVVGNIFAIASCKIPKVIYSLYLLDAFGFVFLNICVYSSMVFLLDMLQRVDFSEHVS